MKIKILLTITLFFGIAAKAANPLENYFPPADIPARIDLTNIKYWLVEEVISTNGTPNERFFIDYYSTGFPTNINYRIWNAAENDWKAETDVVTNYQWNEKGYCTQMGSQAYEYDQHGRLIKVTDILADNNYSCREFGYDDKGNVVSDVNYTLENGVKTPSRETNYTIVVTDDGKSYTRTSNIKEYQDGAIREEFINISDRKTGDDGIDREHAYSYRVVDGQKQFLSERYSEYIRPQIAKEAYIITNRYYDFFDEESNRIIRSEDYKCNILCNDDKLLTYEIECYSAYYSDYELRKQSKVCASFVPDPSGGYRYSKYDYYDVVDNEFQLHDTEVYEYTDNTVVRVNSFYNNGVIVSSSIDKSYFDSLRRNIKSEEYNVDLASGDEIPTAVEEIEYFKDTKSITLRHSQTSKNGVDWTDDYLFECEYADDSLPGETLLYFDTPNRILSVINRSKCRPVAFKRVNKYETTEVSFKYNSSEAYPDGVEAVAVDTSVARTEIFTLSGIKVAESDGELRAAGLEKGIYIIRCGTEVKKVVL